MARRTVNDNDGKYYNMFKDIPEHLSKENPVKIRWGWRAWEDIGAEARFLYEEFLKFLEEAEENN